MKPTKIDRRKWFWFALFLFLLPGQAEGASPSTERPWIKTEARSPQAR